MKILVIGDTHNKLSMVRDIWQKLENIDLVLHTGDHSSDALVLEEELGVPFAFVQGNCDSSGGGEFSKRGGDYAVIDTEYGNILLTHGHRDGAGYSLDKLRYRALENNCVAVVFGHTHVAMVEQLEETFSPRDGSLWFVNPGSLPRPRDGSGGSYGIIRTTEDSFNATIVYYNTVMRKTSGGYAFGGHGGSGGNRDDSSAKGNTGFMGRMLNYIDRF